MKFQAINEYLDQKNEVTILYPGGFKPLTGAHIHLIDTYLEEPNVKKVVLFISPGKRDDITADQAYKIANHVLEDRNIEIVLDKESYSPILAVYRWIEKKERIRGKYALASSTKGNDYNRVEEFTKNYSPEKYGKNLPKGVEIVELPIDAEPLTYLNGEPISASNVREAIKNGDYDSFKENYPELRDDLINFIWNEINHPTEDLEEAGNQENTQSTGSNYERVYPSQKLKSIHNIQENGRSIKTH